MNILSLFKKNKIVDTSVRDRIIETFDFLCQEWGFIIVESFSPYENSTNDVVIYQSHETNMQIDISANRDTQKNNRLRIEIVKLRYGIADYSDIDNYFSHYTLLKLDNSEQDSDYYGWDLSQIDLLKKGANLLTIFTSTEWKDVDLDEQLREYVNKNNFEYNPLWKPFIQPYYKTFRFSLNDLMTKNGYVLIYDSKALPSYAKNSISDKIEYLKSKQILSIKQHDYRDGSDNYSVYLGKKYKLTFKLIGEKSANNAINAIEKII